MPGSMTEIRASTQTADCGLRIPAVTQGVDGQAYEKELLEIHCQIPQAIFIGESLVSQGFVEDNRVIGCYGDGTSQYDQSAPNPIVFDLELVSTQIHLPN